MHTHCIQGLNRCRGVLRPRVRQKAIPLGLAFPWAVHMPAEGYVHDFSIGEEEVQNVFFLYAFCKGADKELGAGTPCQGVIIDGVGRRGRGCWDSGGGRGWWFWGVYGEWCQYVRRSDRMAGKLKTSRRLGPQASPSTGHRSIANDAVLLYGSTHSAACSPLSPPSVRSMAGTPQPHFFNHASLTF